nr:PAS domain S-box protein [Anaerolineales bacterium]
RLFQEVEARRLYLEGVLKSTPDAIVTLDAGQRIVEWNPGAQRLFGYSPEEVIGQNIDDLVTRADVLEEAVGFTQTVMRGEPVHPVETIRYRQDGSPVDVIVAASPIIEGDELIGIVVAYSDISERKRAEKTLRRRLDELVALHAIASAGSETTHQDALIERATQIIGEALHLDNFGVIMLDRASQTLYPHSSHRLRGGGQPLTLRLGEGIVGQVALTGQSRRVPDVRGDPDYLEGDPETRSELCVPLKVGERILGVINTESTQLDAYSEEDERLLTTVADQLATAMEKVRLFEETERLKEFNESLIQNMAEGIVVQDLEGVFTFLNPAAAALLGYTPAELLGQHGMTVVPPDQQPIVVAADERRARRESGSYELELLHKDGSRRSVLISGTPRFEEGRFAGTLAVFADITERKRAEEALRRSLEETARGRHLLLALSQAAQAVQRAHTPEEVYRTIGDEVTALGHHVAVLTLTNERGHLAFSHVTFEETLAQMAEEVFGVPRQDLRIPLEPGSLLQQILDEGEPCFMEKWTDEHIARVLPQSMRPVAGRLTALLGMERSILAPLIVGDKAHGLLIVSSASLTEADIPAMSVFANQAAITIENAQLLQAITEQRRGLQRLSAQLVNAQEAERKRISQELHDEMGQALTAMKINLAEIKRALPSETATAVAERLAETVSLADQTLEQMREMSLELRPAMLDDLGLQYALRWYVSRYARRLGIEVKLEAPDFEGRLAAEAETALYRVVQEALTNVARHAQAHSVRIHLGCGESTVTMVIEDDGQGFDPQEIAGRAPAERGAGLLGMRERVAILGGDLRVESRPGQGTRLSINVPVPQREGEGS